VTVDSGRIVRDPDFHDGKLTGIRVVDRSRLELSCSTLDGEPYLVSLSGLDSLRADNFLQGNIIFELEVFDSDLPLDRVKKAFGVDGDERPAWLDAKLSEMKHGHWTLLDVSSSYGRNPQHVSGST
jgi:hypothetical protein